MVLRRFTILLRVHTSRLRESLHASGGIRIYSLRVISSLLLPAPWFHLLFLLRCTLRDVAGEHTEARLGSYVYFGDAASFHDWDFQTRLRFAGMK